MHASTPEFGAQLRAQLEGRDDDRPDAPALGVSIDLATDRSTFHWVRWGNCTVVRTRDGNRALAGVERLLSEALWPRPPEVRLRCRAVVLPEGGAVLLPVGIEDQVHRIERHLREEGVLLVDGYSTLVDVYTGELVIPSGTELDRSPLLSLIGSSSTSVAEPFLEAGRHRLVALLTTPNTASPGRAVVSILGQLTPAEARPVHQFVDLLAGLPSRTVSGLRRSVVLDALHDLATR